MHVLIVDDDHMICQCLISQIDWEEIGLDPPVIAHNGLEAMEQVARSKPDIIISDVRMPLMDGVEFLRQVRECCPEVPILFMSAYEDFKAAQSAIYYNVKEYIMKPSDREGFNLLQNKLGEIAKQLKTQKAENNSLSDRYEEILKKALKERNSIIPEVLQVIEEQYMSPNLNVNILGRMFHVSPKYLGRIFIAQTGMKLMDYITERRIAHACRQLTESVKSIREISESCGYQDSNYFARVFRNKMKMTPAEYRVKLRKLDREKLWREAGGK